MAVKSLEEATEMKRGGSGSSGEGARNRTTMAVDEKQPEGRTVSPSRTKTNSRSQSPKRQQSSSHSPVPVKEEHTEFIRGQVTVKAELAQAPKLSRSSSQKVTSRAPPMFKHLEDRTSEAKSRFQVINECTYASKYLGYTEHAMECDCAEEWDNSTRQNIACGEDSDCINRATKIECFGDCGCGSDCQNQRFQRRRYADVSVIQTDKKGYGLRVNVDLAPHEFIFEYIGEVINETQFRKRMLNYDEEGIKHFYFMSLSKGEFVDATKKGNLGRFCNHSCNPNCYVDKWVVGEKLRMGIFAERKIKAGEELVFNYNVDRYGADPQPCYCREPNCTGFIGGKTQTERASKLSNVTIEALGIDDGDGWDTAIAKRPRKKKTGEDDEEYVNNVQPKALDEDGVTKVMAALMQCKEKWIAVKLLSRVQRCEDERVRHRVVKMHGYQILNSALSTWKDDVNVILQILDILNQFPRLTKNKISDSKIEATVASLQSCGDERVEEQASNLLSVWSTLEMAFRIPRKKRDPNAASEVPNHFDRRDGARDDRKRRSRSRSRSKSRSKSKSPPRGPAAPTGPRSNVPQRGGFFQGGRPPFRPPRSFNNLPTGWFTATDANGKTYYYSATGQTTWTVPTTPASQPPPPPKPVSATKQLDDIINEITSAKVKTPDKAATPKVTAEEPKFEKKHGKEKWRSLPEEKQKKIYENTILPHVNYVVNKYKTKLPKKDLKRFFKDVTKQIANSDFKKNRVQDPTKITSSHEKNIKKYVKEYFDKAVVKKDEYDKKKAAKAEPNAVEGGDAIELALRKEESDGDAIMEGTDDEAMKDDDSITPITPLDQMANGEGLKRKRGSDIGEPGVELDEEATPSKRTKSETPPTPPPPPPPPPPSDPPAEEEEEEEARLSDESRPLLSPSQ